MKPRFHLVTRADDAGSCRSANEAILKAVEAGTIKNISFMAVGPEIEHAIELLCGRDDIAYGFHVCLNSEWEQVKWGPLTNRPVLVDERGHLLPFPDDTRVAIEREIKAASTPTGFCHPEPANVEMEVGLEIHAQFEHLRNLGLKPSYIDEHMGVGRTVPQVRGEIERLCKSHKLVDAHAVPYLPSVESSGSLLTDLEARFKLAMGARYVWVTHPGKVAPDMNAFYLAGGEQGVVARERDAERQLLVDPRLPELFEKWEVTPTRYDELPR